jgi:hypothetical protein
MPWPLGRYTGRFYPAQSVMQTVSKWFYEACGWHRERCCMCNATGMMPAYGWDGDFLGPTECRSCGGIGGYWITPHGHHVLYPGGPFC